MSDENGNGADDAAFAVGDYAVGNSITGSVTRARDSVPDLFDRRNYDLEVSASWDLGRGF